MPNPQLDATLSDLLASDFAASPVSATGYGLTEYDDRLDDVSADALRARDAAAAAFLARLDAIGDEGLTTDEAIDRDLARAVLRGRLIMAPFEAWKRDPVTYSGPVTSGVFALFLHRLRPDAELAEAATARLDAVGPLVDAGIANLDADLAHPLIVERGRNAAMGALRYVRDLAWQDLPDDPARERMKAAGARAAAELERFVAHLEAFLPRASGSWQLGEEGYTRILREREVLPDDARQLRERGQREFDRLDAEMTDLAKDATGNPDYVAVLRENDADHPTTEQAMLEAYTEWTEKARAFLVDTGLVSFPDGETCAVVPSPVFQRPVLGVASYIAPPAFSDKLKGHFFVPFAPDGATEEEIQGRLSNNSFGSIPTTSVHEAYPGHHWHLVMRKSAPTSRVRKVYGTPYFNEGWALYTERVMRERGFFEHPLHELQHLSATIFRAARIIVDTSLHLGEMTFDEAVAFMRDKAALPEPVAIAEVGRYCWWPTQASSYLTGCLEILEIRRRYLDARGFAGIAPADVPVEAIRDFHDTIARTGSLPLGLADRAVMASLG
ncbi:MAG TPA: DUF885 domain-containing protein [Anaeromyxobacteraceae bacterium]|nr:DUF885 domain-containing protein [Anaeromyxobacteraceae bacterium]